MLDFLTLLAIQTGTDPNSTTSVNIPTGSADDLLTNGLNLVYFLAGTVAVIIIVMAGIMYASSAGNSGTITKAKNLIMYAVAGLVIVMVAFIITNFVIGSFN